MPVDKSGDRVRKMFAAIAPRYDLLNHLLSMQVDRYWRWRTVALVEPDDVGPILDVCTGTGDLALAFHRRTRGRVDIVASDFCRPMLEIGAEKARRKGAAERVKFVEADTQHLPFPDNTFSIVAVAFGLRNVSDTNRGLREMARVCRPGGRVAVLEFSQPQWQPFAAVYGWYFRHVLPRLGQWLARNDQEAYSYLPQSVGEFPAGANLLQRMEQAGMYNTRFYSLTFGIATLYLGEK
jgi:demethylmenaquinone methyltransferase/2-methoxy-6-polyprenyl-1,4-benzoquinol methylase